MSDLIGRAMLAILLIALVAAGPASQPARRKLKSDTPEAVRKTWESSESRKAKLIADAKATVAKERKRLGLIQSGKVDTKLRGVELEPTRDAGLFKFTFPSAKEKQDHIIGQKAEIASVEAALKEAESAEFVPEVATLQEDLHQDFIGKVRSAKVRQVVDDKSAIVSMVYNVGSYTSTGRQTFEQREVDLYLEGIDMAGIADGQGVGIGLIWIKGTKRYATAGGSSRTILRAEPIRIDDYLE